jgi:integrase
MRGSIRQRSKGSFRLTLEFGYVFDPATGKKKRIQKFITFRGTKRKAQEKLAELLHEAKHGTFVEPDKRTVGEWLDEWVDLAIKPPRRTQRAYETYRGVIANHLKPGLGSHRLQGLRSIDVESLLADRSNLAPATLEKIFTVLSSALKAAMRSQLVARNVATLISNRPQAPEGHPDAVENCWTADDAAAFMRVAKAAGPREAAFYALALDSGCRKSELAGLLWSDVDFANARILVRQQLLSGGREPVFTPTKGKRARSIELAPETIELLRAYKQRQAEIKLRNRAAFRDHGLVFCKDAADGKFETLGDPLSVNNLGQREFSRLISLAKVKPITLHGLRHTCASLLLSNGVPANVVQERLGHKRIEMTLGIYAHVLPGQQRDAARRLGMVLYRG